ncbi:MAG: GNAT family N-acetyltransferase [Clostridiales bacterium]|nr:GNAT family N-acetyltransferase [Clostridiales bacterium]
MKIIRLEDNNNDVFKKICEWNYDWWNDSSFEEVECYFKHSLCKNNRLPQTFIALIKDEPVGMYQICMSDDLYSRPDIYPWLANVYVNEKYRGNGIWKQLMNTVKENAKNIGLNELYLYTKHVGLYEKFGWKFIEEVNTFKDDSSIERLYKLDIE